MSEHCSSCNEETNPLSDEEVYAQLENLAEWTYDPEEKMITRYIQFKGFTKTMKFINSVAEIAKAEKHHPDVSFGYNYAAVSFQTHSAKGVTRNDLICARMVSKLLA